LQKFIGHDLTDIGVSVISTNNLGFDNFVNIFKRVKPPFNQIPIAVLTDADRKNSIGIETYKTKINSSNNKVECFVGDQLYNDTDLNKSKKRRTTFEKIIFDKTIELKKMYIQSYNLIHQTSPILDDIKWTKFYLKMKKEKAPLAQEVAQLLSKIREPTRSVLKAEIETNLEYIVSAINHIVPVTPQLTSEE